MGEEAEGTTEEQEKDIWTAALEEWDNDIGPEWEKNNSYESIFEPAGLRPNTKCHGVLATGYPHESRSLIDAAVDLVTGGSTLSSDGGDSAWDEAELKNFADQHSKSYESWLLSATGVSRNTPDSYKKFVISVWELEKDGEDTGCEAMAESAKSKARAAFLYEETITTIQDEAGTRAVSDVRRCATSLSKSASSLPGLIDQFKLDSVENKLYTSQTAMERAIAQETVYSFDKDLPSPLSTLSTSDAPPYMSNANIFPPDLNRTNRGFRDLDHLRTLTLPESKSIANYSNLEIKDGVKNLTYSEIPPSGSPPAALPASSFPWYYAGLTTAVVRIAIKLSEAINRRIPNSLRAAQARGS